MATRGVDKTTRSVTHWGMFDAEVKDGRLVGVRPYDGDPNPSPMIETLPSAVHHECRVDRPMVRKGFLDHGKDSDRTRRGAEPFVALSWDDALELVAEELARVKDTHGNNSIYASSGWASAGCFHNARMQLQRFMNLFGGAIGEVTNYSFGAASVIVPHVVGTMDPIGGRTSFWPTIAKHTGLMVAFGGLSPKNLQINMHGLARHQVVDWQRKARANGTEFVCVSPRRDDTAAMLDAEWLAIRPNTDAALMLGLMHCLVEEDLHDKEFLDRCAVGFDRLRNYLMGETDGIAKSAEWAACVTDIDAGAIRGLARRMARSRTMVAASWSVQRCEHGEQPYWLAIALAAMLGQVGLPGGGFGFGYGSTHGNGTARTNLPPPKLPIGQNPVADFIPVARVCDMLLNPGKEFEFNGRTLTYPDTRLIYWCGGNPFHKQQDINRMLRAWAKPETVIVHEPWWTPAARRADIVLPCTTTLERNDIAASGSDPFFAAMPRAIDPVGGARTEYDIYADLAGRLGFRDAHTEGRTEMDWLRHLYDVTRQQAAEIKAEMPSFDEFWEMGLFELPVPEEPPVLFSGFRDDPAAHPLKTPSGRIEIFSETIHGFGYDDCPGLPQWMEPSEWLGAPQADIYALHLISNQPRTRLHSQLDCGSVSREAKIAGREPVWLNPDDAAERGIENGQIVRIYNDRGACLAGAVITDALRPGVIQLATGAWYDPEIAALPGSLDKHGNPNVLTQDKPSSQLAQACAAQSCLVEVERYDGEAPEITAFDQPETV